ncbi:MAG: amidohydrolase family protein [Candidatus Marinimicrobia bacterium]|nr:amidohydrolase family protein [Candidatus Neomarinimicrobiota bacterium]
MEEKYIIGNGIVTDGFSFLLENGAILIEGGKIKKIDKTDKLKNDKIDFIDLEGRLVLPGLLNPHNHLYSALATGLAPRGEMNNFPQILKNLWWHLDKKLDEESIYYSAIAGLIDSVKYGVTTVFDHHASMNLVDGSLEIIEKAFRKIGLKGLLCFEISDRMGEKNIQSQIEENIKFYEKHKNDNQIKGVLGLHANFTLSDKTLSTISKQKPTELPIHIHCGEAIDDLKYCQEKGYDGPVHRLHKNGLLSENSLLVHCIHLTETDYKLLDKIQPTIVSNPESNANNNVGKMNTDKIKKYLLGTDGMTGNILGTMRSHFLRRNGNINNPLEILFESPANIVNKYFYNSGKLAVGNSADIAITDYKPVTKINIENLFYHLIYGVEGQKMFMTIADGKILYQDGKMKTINENEIFEEIKKVANNLHRKFYE